MSQRRYLFNGVGKGNNEILWIKTEIRQINTARAGKPSSTRMLGAPHGLSPRTGGCTPHSGLQLWGRGRRQKSPVQQPQLRGQDVQRNPSGLQPANLFTKPHYYVITFVISEQTLYLANPLCYRAAHPSLEQELTSKGIKRRRRLPKGSLGRSFTAAGCPLLPFPFPSMCGILPHRSRPFLPARH